MHFLIALGKLIKSGTECSLGFPGGVAHLRKALHMYPNSDLLRNLLGYLLICGEGSNGAHFAVRCCSGDASSGPINGLKFSVLVVLLAMLYALPVRGFLFQHAHVNVQMNRRLSSGYKNAYVENHGIKR